MLSKKSLDILTLLDEAGELKEIANKLNLSERAIRYEIENLNYYLTKFGFDEIQIISRKVALSCLEFGPVIKRRVISTRFWCV